MKNDQKHTPKYWVLHDTDSDEVLIATASKSHFGCADKSQSLYPLLYQDYLDCGHYKIDLIELVLVKV